MEDSGAIGSDELLINSSHYDDTEKNPCCWFAAHSRCYLDGFCNLICDKFHEKKCMKKMWITTGTDVGWFLDGTYDLQEKVTPVFTCTISRSAASSIPLFISLPLEVAMQTNLPRTELEAIDSPFRPLPLNFHRIRFSTNSGTYWIFTTFWTRKELKEIAPRVHRKNERMNKSLR